VVRAWAWFTRPLWRFGLILSLPLLVAAYPFAVGEIARRVATARLNERLGPAVRVQVRGGRADLTGITLRDIDIDIGAGLADGPPAGEPLAHLGRVRVPFAALLTRRGLITINDATVNARRGGPTDNLTGLITALRRNGPAPATSGASSPSGRLPGISVERARVTLHDAGSGLTVEVGSLSVLCLPGQRVEVRADKIEGLLAFGSGDRGPRFGAEAITIVGPLDGIHLHGYPTLTVSGGFATPLPSLTLTGIHGKIHPASGPDQVDPAQIKALVVDLDGSYGGARETLWTARGGLNPGAREGQLSLRAERFSLREIAEVLPKTILSPGDTTVDAAFDVSWADGAVRFGGDMQVSGLSLEHPALAPDPVLGIGLGLILRGTAFPEARRVAIDRLEAHIAGLQGRLSGFVELAPGSFTFADGNKLGFLPRLELTLQVPPLPCGKALASLPPTLVPALQGFELQGTFGAEITARVDYADLEALELKGKVGIDGCKVLKAPPAVKALVSGESVSQTVEVPKAPPARGAAPNLPGETEDLQFMVGPENPDFVPYEQISPSLVAAIMTTEDNGFFKHRGWVTSEFRTALKRNLQRGGFRGGASSITMQMVKNVLLSQEKTLSRKLQELFLVWYLEQEIPKERILELYFNAIEFGPRIYGIGSAARHYFGKNAADLTPLEGAFFSSILPSPKRRYVQYCHGAPTPQWDRYLHRILAKMHERGRITDEEYETSSTQKLVFDRRELGFNERQCLDWVKKITARPEPETPPEMDLPADGDTEAGTAEGGRLPVGKLRRLFSRDLKRTSSARAAKLSVHP